MGFMRAPKKKHDKMRAEKVAKTQCQDPKWVRTYAAMGVIETAPTLLPTNMVVMAMPLFLVK